MLEKVAHIVVLATSERSETYSCRLDASPFAALGCCRHGLECSSHMVSIESGLGVTSTFMAPFRTRIPTQEQRIAVGM
jgi:hypothetical protein